MTLPRLLFVTGRLAEPALRRTIDELGKRVGFEGEIAVLPITVAALMTTDWIARQLPTIPAGCRRAILPGYVRGELTVLESRWGVPVERGPKDLRRLAEHFGLGTRRDERYGRHDIEIVAEINHAPQYEPAALVAEARRLAADGADLIDLGCNPGANWSGIGDAVRRLRDLGLRVSVDSLDPDEIRRGVAAGAELVLSLNGSNRFLAEELDVEWVAIPDDPATLDGLEQTLQAVDDAGGRVRIDPILEPIGLGFAASLGRYLDVRRRWPDAEMLMGIGNLTELTDVDSAGINVLLLGFCQELGIRSVLTTQVIPWARSSVRECDLARRLTHFAVEARVPPKRVDPRLVMLRDATVSAPSCDDLDRLANDLKDANYRLFVVDGELHLVAAGLHLHGPDPFALFESLMRTEPTNIDPGHAFYLGYEAAKGITALTLGKDYRQDEALDWGFLTRPEQERHRLVRGKRRSEANSTTDRDGEARSSDGQET